MELEIPQEKITAQRIGQLMGRLRFLKGREGGTGNRGWTVSLSDLRRGIKAHALVVANSPPSDVTAVTGVTSVTAADIGGGDEKEEVPEPGFSLD
jgi:hypothetical protein